MAELEALIAAFAEAPFVEDGWARALKRLASATGSSRGQLIGLGGPSLIPFNLVTDFDEAPLRAFVDIEGGRADRNFRVAATRGTLELVDESHYRAARSRIVDSLYDDFCRTYDIPHGVQTVLRRGNGQLVGLAVLRGERDGVSDADQRAIFAEAAPHALRAVRTQQAIDGQGAKLLAGSLEAVSAAAIILDGAGAVQALTPGAEAELRGALRLQLRERRLRAARAADQARLDTALHAALGPVARESRIALRAQGDAADPIVLTVCPLALGPDLFGYAPRILVVISGRDGDDLSARLLCEAFDLTPSEAAVAIEIARGVPREQIAAARGVSPGTVHAQLKAIFGKTSVNREVGLAIKVRRLLQL